MSVRLNRSIREPIRVGLTWEERWRGPDGGLIACWESGREMRIENATWPTDPKPGTQPEPAAAYADRGELLPLPWKGGVSEKLKAGTKYGSLQYLAMWQGLRHRDLDIVMTGETVLVCTRTRQEVIFKRDLPPEPGE